MAYWPRCRAGICLCIASMAGVLLVGLEANGNIIQAYDHFMIGSSAALGQYSAAALNGQNPSNFPGAVEDFADPWTAGSAFSAISQGLTHELVQEAGGSVLFSSTTALAQTASRSISSPFGGGSDPCTLWISSLHRVSHVTSTTKSMININAILGGVFSNWGIDGASLKAFGGSAIESAEPNTTYLFIVKMEKNTGGGSPFYDRASVWINPSNADTEAELGTPDKQETELNLWFDSAMSGIILAGSTPGMVDQDLVQVQFDEIQIGNTFEDLTIMIPEPLTLLLLGMGAFSLRFGRRRGVKKVK